MEARALAMQNLTERRAEASEACLQRGALAFRVVSVSFEVRDGARGGFRGMER